VITSRKPLELAMLLETAINLTNEKANVKYVDLTGASSKIFEFPIGDRLNSISFKRKMDRIEEKLNLMGIEKIIVNFHKKVLPNNSKIKNFAEAAAKNEIISIKRESDPCLECHKNLFSDLVNAYTNSYLSLDKILSLHSFSNVYIYNGRFIIGNAVWNLCDQHKINIKFLEQANMGFPNRYWLFDKPVHSPVYRAKIVKDFYGSSTNLQKRKFDQYSKEWYSARTAGVSQNFTSKQNINYENMSDKLKIISYFHSSEDELILSNLKETSWGTQFEIINNLCELIQSKHDFKLLIRIHPNLKYKSITEIKIWEAYLRILKEKYRNVDYFWFDSPINTYSLIKSSQIVFTSGSTIGPESAYMGKSNVLCGNSLYSKMGMSYKPKNFRDLRENFNFYLKHPNKSKFLENAKRFGYFQILGGLFYKHITVNSDATRINYDGVILNYTLLYSAVIRADKLYLKIFRSQKRCNKC
jgi:hypothetical protein